MGLCDFIRGRQANRDNPTPMVGDGDLTPDITIPETPAEPPECSCFLEGDGLRWRNSPIIYWVEYVSFGTFAPELDNMLHRIFDQYRNVSNLRAVETSRMLDANIRIYMRVLDGMNGTLGVAYQAAGQFEYMDDHVVMEPPFVGDIVIDLSENWRAQDLENVLLHEIGHAIGLAHFNDTRAVMNPFYVGTSRLHSIDTREVVKRYGNGRSA